MINIALVGNPNTGKTTLFNSLTLSHEHTGNWHGVTVEEKAKVYKYRSRNIKIVDLPGIYSLCPYSFEEEVSTNFLIKNQNTIVVNVCDSCTLQKNLYLTLSLMELGLPMIIVVNQIEKRQLCKVDYVGLEKMLGVKVLHISARDKRDINLLNNEILALEEKIEKKERFSYSTPYIEKLNLNSVVPLKANVDKKQFYQTKILEDDDNIKKMFNISNKFDRADVVAKARYDYVDKIITRCTGKRQKDYGQSKFDKFVLNKFLAIPIFLCFMALVFYVTFFSVGKALSNLFSLALETLIAKPLLGWIDCAFGSSWLTSFVSVALIGGVNGVLSFLPQVALLFLFLSVLEDSGYLSRVAFVFDDILAKVGLSGKSVYTLLMGFGCSTSAILTARVMEDENSKRKTALLTPYMSCSAKFPIYTVLGGAFFGAKNIFVIMGLYLLGVLIAVSVSYFFEQTSLKSKQTSFILEFPSYHTLSFNRIFSVLTQNVKLFLLRVGGQIVAMNVIVWVLSNFTFSFKFVQNGSGSMLESFGKILAPVFSPLGFGSWALVSALLAGFVAKEVIISSIAMFNGVCDLSLLPATLSTGVASFSSVASVISYLVFCLLYFPCLASLSVMKSEIGSKWTFFGVVTQFAVAYVLSFVIFNVAKLFEMGLGQYFIAIVVLLFCVVLSTKFLINHIRRKKCASCDGNCKGC